MNIDLNIDNYELDDILNLFKIDYDFNHDDLKRVKKYVLQTHPDKSKLSKEYFLFFTKAYKIIYAIYNTREKREKSTTYILNEDDDNKELLKKVSKTHPKCVRRPVSLPRTVHQSRKLRELRAKHLTPEQNKNKACVMRMRVRFEESYGKRVWKIAIVASETAGRADEGLCSH